jgi:hypothetical protein
MGICQENGVFYSQIKPRIPDKTKNDVNNSKNSYMPDSENNKWIKMGRLEREKALKNTGELLRVYSVKSEICEAIPVERT